MCVTYANLNKVINIPAVILPQHPNLGYLAPPGQFLMGAKLFIGTPLDAKRRCPQKIWYGLCENAWFPWQPIADLRMGVCLQKYSYLSCYLSQTTKLNTKLKLRHWSIIPVLHLHIHIYS